LKINLDPGLSQSAAGSMPAIALLSARNLAQKARPNFEPTRCQARMSLALRTPLCR